MGIKERSTWRSQTATHKHKVPLPSKFFLSESCKICFQITVASALNAINKQIWIFQVYDEPEWKWKLLLQRKVNRDPQLLNRGGRGIGGYATHLGQIQLLHATFQNLEETQHGIKSILAQFVDYYIYCNFCSSFLNLGPGTNQLANFHTQRDNRQFYAQKILNVENVIFVLLNLFPPSWTFLYKCTNQFANF